MRSFSLVAAILVVLPLTCLSIDLETLKGTWSGSWTPKGGVIDAVTVEFHEENGKLVGSFRTPVPMNYSKAEYDSKTGKVTLEATDPKSGKLYKVDGKLNNFEIKGTLTAGDVTGDVLLIKWTYVPR